jgi:hypothetical protein
MFNCIFNFFNKEQPKVQHKNDLFNKQYRSSYNKLWIQKLRDYP